MNTLSTKHPVSKIKKPKLTKQLNIDEESSTTHNEEIDHTTDLHTIQDGINNDPKFTKKKRLYFQ